MLDFSFEGLEVESIQSSVQDKEAGAIILFVGTVRAQSAGKKVIALEYEAYREMAIKQFEHIENEIKNKWEIKHINVVHRLGKLSIGEISIVIAASAPHGDAAFHACRYAIEEIKKNVPIWKKEYFEDGATWVGGN